MAFTRTEKFLPEVFRSTTNKRFLGATLDQLVTDAYNIPVNGYIGRTFAPTYRLGDNYIKETTRERSQYQLEPSVVVKDAAGEVKHTATFVDLLQAIANNGGFVNDQQRLFASEYYNFDGHFDYDKFVNYSNYYWMPNGPASVAVSANSTPLSGTYVVTRNEAIGGYTFTGFGGHPNTQLTLTRGGSYNFVIDQPGHPFWIQTQTGLSGINTEIPTLSTRQILGVTNNGTDSGTIRFSVPQAGAQDFYINMPLAATVNAAVSFDYTDIQNQMLSKFLEKFPSGLDGLNNLLNGKTFVFINNKIDASNWTTPAIPGEFVGTSTSSILPGSVIKHTDFVSAWKITLLPSGTDSLIQIAPITQVPKLQKVYIGSGKTYASAQFWVNNNLLYNEVPAITSDNDYLYYQDGTSTAFAGQIKFVDNVSSTIDATVDIIGSKSYTSPNGVVFTNGLKVMFDTFVTPAAYAGNEFYVEGVGTSIALVPVAQLVAPENAKYGIDTSLPDYVTISRASQDVNPWTRSNRWFHKDVLQFSASFNKTAVDYGPNVQGRRAIIEFEPNLQLFNSGAQAKQNVDLFFTQSTDAFLNIEGQQSYTYVDPTTHAQVPLTQGMRVIFSNDYDINVVNQIYTVNIQNISSSKFIQLVATTDSPVLAGESVLASYNGYTHHYDGVQWAVSQARTGLNQQPLFDLVDNDGISFGNQTTYPNSTFAGSKLFGYAVNPNSSVNDTALGFPLVYQNFNNIGDIVFSSFYDHDSFTYTNNTTTGTTATIECNSGFIAKNTGLNSVSKLTDWITNNAHSQQYQVLTKIYDGKDITISASEAIYPARNSVAAGTYAFVQIDVLPIADGLVPTIKVYVNNSILTPGADYNIVSYGVYYLVVLTNPLALTDKVDVLLLSDKASALGYYQIPSNLDLNPLNQPFPMVNGVAPSAITLGQLRTHYSKLIENTTVSSDVSVPLRDKYLKAHGGTLLQQSSSLVYAMSFMTDKQMNFVNAINLARNEYTRFKNKFLTLCTTLKGLDYNNPVSGVDAIMSVINANKNGSFPWYYSDMVAQGSDFVETTYTVLSTRQTRYEISSIFDITKLSNRAVMVYLNGKILTADHIDLYYDGTTPSVVILRPLTVGDVITIRDYTNTDGNFVPETPVKLGLAQDYPPSKFLDTSYVTPIEVIIGHDGSVTPAFGDFRDDFLLELETRIYNNLKIDYNDVNPFNAFDTIPGKFRKTDYSIGEWNQTLTQYFLQWAGVNSVDYTANSWYDANNPWTWNYGKFRDSFTGAYLQGSWRAIYDYWFDTTRPHITPWAMLGLAQKPLWWDKRYGTAPYTNGNLTLWADLEAGYVWNGSDSAAYVDANFARPGLSKIIPVDSAGNLLDPTRIGIIGQYNQPTAGAQFAIGQQGPVETTWRRSSDFGFAQQLAFALTRPAEYFGTQIELGTYRKNPITGQYSSATNSRPSPANWYVMGEKIPGGGVARTSGYVNWIFDYVKNQGLDPVKTFAAYFSNFDVQLVYRVGGFTDKSMLTVTAEQTSPGSTNASVIIPDENYTVFLDTPIPLKTISYSAVIVTKTTAGYSVGGYDTTNPVFPIYASVANNKSTNLNVGDTTVQLYQTGNKNVSYIPYGTTFANIQQVADFLVSYERYLVTVGFVFEVFDHTLSTTRNWTLSIKEFLFWAQQGWAPGTILVLNPVADRIVVKTPGTVVGEIKNMPTGSRVLDTNFVPIRSNAFNVLRQDSPFGDGNVFEVFTVDGTSTLAFAELDLVQFEHTLVFDNVDNFGDIIYIPEQGTRQYRLKLNGAVTGGWDGALSATGYIYSNPVINAWQQGTDYKQGDIVEFNNSMYTAPVDVPASQNFSLSNWTKIEKKDIQTGLLPSLGHNAQVFQNIYDVDNPPLDQVFQTFSGGLIGFRERPFLSNLGMSVTTQTKFYQGYIQQKGTQNAIDALTKATFVTVNSTIDTYEEWAFQVGTYGDINNNQFVEFELDDTVFTTNPVAFETATDFDNSNIIVNLGVTSNVWNTNYSTTISSMYNDRGSSAYNSDLPSCGFVNLADVDHQIFDLTTATTVPTLAEGDTIWTTNDYHGTWNVYRASSDGNQVLSLQYTLDGFATFTFWENHNGSVNDYFVVQGFSQYFDGLYQIVSVPSSTTATVVVADVADLLRLGSLVNGVGSVFKLLPMSVLAQPSNAIEPPAGWLPGDKIWVSGTTLPGYTGQWTVWEYGGGGFSVYRQEQARVDITSINRAFIFDKTTNIITAPLDFIDPIKGKVLNAVGVDIDYQLPTDPALYNAGTGTVHPDMYWGPAQVGKVWWDIGSVRYIDYEQDQLIYRMNNWGLTFPGSQILVYEWVESIVPPSQYVATYGDGVPMLVNDSAYSTYGAVTASSVNTRYYFWVANKTTIATGKSNSVYSIAAAIENPQAQGIPYMTVLANNAIAIYNATTILSGTDSVLHLSTRNTNSGVIHSEYALVQEGNPKSTIPTIIESKLVDSLAGQDKAGNQVPDPTLPVSRAYGIQIRPRQSMFTNRTLAVSNFITYVNNVMINYPVIERKIMTTLNSSEPLPTDVAGLLQTVSTYAELTYVKISLSDAGKSILVLTDETNSGKWGVYMLTSFDSQNNPIWSRTDEQSYKTDLYWTTADWYDTTFDPTEVISINVANNLEFGRLSLTANTYVKILDNGNGQFVVYYIDSTLNKNLVAIQNGTVKFSSGTIPALELRQLVLAIQNDIFVDDLAIKYNELFFIMIKYALTEQRNLDWVFKTSFLSATQYIRALEQFPSYISDNQTYYLDYINEVKPYRTTVRQFVIDYVGSDQYGGDSTDFDLQPQWDANLQVYRSPNGEQYYDEATLSTTNGAYSQWYKNHTYSVVDINVTNPGSGYVVAPQITIMGGGGTGATAYSVIDGSGSVSQIVVTNPGSGYTTTPRVIFNGTNTSASAYPVLKTVLASDGSSHNLVRSMSTTIKFDRLDYTNSNTFVFWENVSTGQVIPAGTILVNNDKLYSLDTQYVVPSPTAPSTVHTFPIDATTQVGAGSFNTANDRIVAFNGNLDLSLTQDGLSYPGVVVDGNTYAGGEYDTTIQSQYGDVLGTNISDIDVDGGAYVSTYSSRAPEELVPGRTYDNFNMTVYDTAGISFREYKGMGGDLEFFAIPAAASTKLSQPLHITDTVIHLDDSTALPMPNTVLALPGVAFINGERIIYWGKDDSTNTLLQIRRAADGTASALIHPAGSTVVDGSIAQAITTNPLSTVTTSGLSGYQTSSPSAVTYALTLTQPITVNINDTITQQSLVPTWTPNTVINTSYIYYSGNTYAVTGNTYGATFTTARVKANVAIAFSGNVLTTVRLQAMQSLTNATVVPVIVLGGAIQGLPEVFDGNVGFDPGTFLGNGSVTPFNADRIPYEMYPNGTVSSSTFLQPYPISVSTMVAGNPYVISTTGTTDWVSLGAPAQAKVSGNISNGTTFTSSGNVLVANIAQSPYYGNLRVGTVITGAGIAANTVITSFIGIQAPYLRKYTVNTPQLVPGNVTITGQPALGTTFVPTVTGSGTGQVTISNSSAFIAQDTQHVWVFNSTTSTYTDIGAYAPTETFDAVNSVAYINGAPTGSYIIDSYILGKVDNTGMVYVPSGSQLNTSQSWYTRGISTPSDGRGLDNSTTAAVTILKSAPSVVLKPGQTP